MFQQSKVRFGKLKYFLGSKGSGNSMTYGSGKEDSIVWSALLYGRKRWIFYKPQHAFQTREPILEWLKRNEGSTSNGISCEQPSNSILLIPKGWGRGTVHMTDVVGVVGEVVLE